MFDVWHSARRCVNSGDLKLEPLPGGKTAATIAATFRGFNVVAFSAAIGPAGIPPPVLDGLSADIRAVVDSREFAGRTVNLDIDAKGNTPSELGALDEAGNGRMVPHRRGGEHQGGVIATRRFADTRFARRH